MTLTDEYVSLFCFESSLFYTTKSLAVPRVLNIARSLHFNLFSDGFSAHVCMLPSAFLQLLSKVFFLNSDVFIDDVSSNKLENKIQLCRD